MNPVHCVIPSLNVLAGSAEPDTSRVFIWSLVLIFAIIGLFVVVQVYRKWWNAEEAGGAGAGFTLSDLRRLVKEGKMTSEEYEKAKVAIVGSVKASVARAEAEKAAAKASGMNSLGVKDSWVNSSGGQAKGGLDPAKLQGLPPGVIEELRRGGELGGGRVGGEGGKGPDGVEDQE